MTPVQRLTVITLGVKDVVKMRTFYEQKFGWTPMSTGDDIAFFRLNGFVFSLCPARLLADDAGVPSEGQGFRHFTLAYNVHSREEVDATMATLAENGVRVVKQPEQVFWGGYRGYVADIEDNLWEICWNPMLELDEKGDVR